MKAWWADYTGLARAAAILSTGLGISIGLCGLNFIAVIKTGSASNGLAGALIITAYLELAGMIICGVGLIVVAIVFIVRAIYRTFTERNTE